MLSIKGIYNGENIILLEKVNIKKTVSVIVTFLEDDSNKDFYELADKNPSFNFLKEPQEDIYSEKDLKKKY